MAAMVALIISSLDTISNQKSNEFKAIALDTLLYIDAAFVPNPVCVCWCVDNSVCVHSQSLNFQALQKNTSLSTIEFLFLD